LLAQRVWEQGSRKRGIGRTVTLKLKTDRFRILTRSLTADGPPTSAAALASVARRLCERVGLPAATRYRLVGVGMSNFPEPHEVQRQPPLFAWDESQAADTMAPLSGLTPDAV